MPIILIIVGIVVALGVGSFMFSSKPQETTGDVVTPVAQVENRTASNTPPATVPVAEAAADPAIKSTPATPNPITNTPPPTTPKPTPTAPVTNIPNPTYKDGTYTVTTSYIAPSRTTHNVTATLTILNDVVTTAAVNFSGEKAETSSQYQSRFSQNYQSEVVGKKLDNISLTRVGGASLTTGAYNKALLQVKTEARP